MLRRGLSGTVESGHEHRHFSNGRPVTRGQTARIAILLTLGAAFASLFAFGSRVHADVTYTYNSDSQLTQVCNNVSGQAAAYGYDPDGNITGVTPTSCPTLTPTATATP